MILLDQAPYSLIMTSLFINFEWRLLVALRE